MKRRSIRTVLVAALCSVALVAVLGPNAAGAHGGGRGHEHGRDRDARHLERHRHGDHGRRHGHSPHRGGSDPVRTVAGGLNGPFGLTVDGKTLYVAQSDVGLVTKVNLRNGRTRTAVELPGVTSVTTSGDRLVMVTGAPGPPEESEGEPPPGETPPEDAPPVEAAPVAEATGAARQAQPAEIKPMSVYVAKPGHRPRLVADLLEYELEHNPDGQLQFGPDGQPVDALSNPFDVLHYGRHSVLVADAGANAVLKVSERGEVSTFFVPPLVTTGACAGLPNNDPEHAGCDSVPTGLAWGPRGTLYVSTLSAEVPGEGRIYVLNRHGRVLDVISGFNGPTGVAVGHDGTLYVSEVLHNAPPGEIPEGFDPATVGRIVKVSPRGHRTYAAVTMPTGLEVSDGTLYASAWSIAGMIGMSDVGQVVTVGKRAFVRAPAPAPEPDPDPVPDT